MKEKTLFECELCHTQYASKADAISCENNHNRVEAVCKERFISEKQDSSGYPIDVILRMTNGVEVRYSRK